MKTLLHLLAKLGTALGGAASKVKSKIFPHILDHLSNKAADVRKDVLAVMDEWGESVGAGHLLVYIPDRLKMESP